MCAFRTLRTNYDSTVIKELNRLMRYEVRLAQTEAKLQFFMECTRTDIYPPIYVKHLRRMQIRPTTRALRRHVTDLAEQIKQQLAEFSTLIAEKQEIVQKLSSVDQALFLNYVQTVVSQKKPLQQTILEEKQRNNRSNKARQSSKSNPASSPIIPENATPGHDPQVKDNHVSMPVHPESVL
ncbi:unnamed protein product [Echinostoma caproni]|uniref:L27 domain-containing protein n=1 Tax=Echinostoma caproni TaxID=27848 RepID=A0A183AJC4_9TREM|nr:unnamed protein product [Echinostoma caproni]